MSIAGWHFLLAAATDRYEAARARCEIPQCSPGRTQIVFTKGGTEAINLVS